MKFINKIYSYILDIYAHLFGKAIFFKLNRFIFDLSARGLGIQNYKNFRLTGESKFMKVFSEMYRKDKNLVVFDVGANKGDYISLILNNRMNKSIQVFAFEPGIEQYKYLVKNYTGTNVHIFGLACSNKNGESFFYSDGATGEFSSLYSSVFEGRNNISYKKIKIKTIKLDNIVSRQRVKKIDLLKIDTEGSEYEVLEGSKRIISGGIVGIIQFEFNSMNVSSKVFLKDFILLLKGYTFYRLLPDGILKLDSYNPLYWEIFSFQNFIAVRNNLVKKFENEYKN